MKLICSKSNLLTGVQTVAKAVPNKTTMSILECILIDARDAEIKLMANDMELGIETIIEGEIAEKGIVALDAKIFLEIVRKLPDSEITIVTEDTLKTTITCEKSKFKKNLSSSLTFFESIFCCHWYFTRFLLQKPYFFVNPIPKHI